MKEGLIKRILLADAEREPADGAKVGRPAPALGDGACAKRAQRAFRQRLPSRLVFRARNTK